MNFIFNAIKDYNSQTAYKFSIYNLILFFFFSLTNYFFEYNFNLQIVFISIFIFGSFLTFVLFFISRDFLSPIVWLTLGTFVFIGLGSLSSLLEIHNFFDKNLNYLIVDIKFAYILNSSALLIIYFICYLFNNHTKTNKYNLRECILGFVNDKILVGILLIILTFLLIRIFYFFPLSENYILNSIIHKFSFIEPGLVVLFAVRLQKANMLLKFLIIIFFTLEIFIASLLFSKFKILIIILSLCLGLIIYKKNIINILSSGIIFLLVLLFITPVITVSRTHNIFITSFYKGIPTTVNQTVSIMKDSVVAIYGTDKEKTDISYQYYKNFLISNISLYSKDRFTTELYLKYVKKIIQLKITQNDFLKITKNVHDENFDVPKFNHVKQILILGSRDYLKNQNKERRNISSDITSRIEYYLIRFDVVTTQRFLMSQYDKELKGETLKDFWHILVPRIFWKEKPNLINHGVHLHNTFYLSSVHKGFQSSSLAPTFYGEAYWNFGWKGLIIVSALFGFLISFFNKLSSNYNNKNITISYLLISVSVIHWSAMIESWLLQTVIGEFIILISLFIILRFLLFILEKINNKFSN